MLGMGSGTRRPPESISCYCQWSPHPWAGTWWATGKGCFSSPYPPPPPRSVVQERLQARQETCRALGRAYLLSTCPPGVPGMHALVQTAMKSSSHPLMVAGGGLKLGLDSPPMTCSPGSARARLRWAMKTAACTSLLALASLLAPPSLGCIFVNILLITCRPLFPAGCVALSFISGA